MNKVCGVLICLLLAGCASRGADPTAVSVRMRFEPGSAPSSPLESSGGAVWTSLATSPISSDKNTLRLMAHAGVGHTFPVAEEDGPTLFEVLLKDGDDDAVSLEIISEQGSKSIELKRDETAHVEIAGVTYNIRYPAVYVASTAPEERRTTNKAMLIVSKPQ